MPKRYTKIALPSYRYIPGKNCRPTGLKKFSNRWDEKEWKKNQAYLYGRDLFNHGYWWELHEVWEKLWLATDRKGIDAQFLQGVIQIGSAFLKKNQNRAAGSHRLFQSGIKKLEMVQKEKSPFAGIRLKTWIPKITKRYANYKGLVLLFALFAPMTAAAQYKPAPIRAQNIETITATFKNLKIVFRGNVLIQDDVLYQALRINPQTAVNAKTLRTGLNRLYELYRRHGYTLAQIKTEKRKDRWLVYIDEGRLKGIMIQGLNWYETYMLRKNLFPHQVFNAKLLEKKLALWKDTGNFSKITYEHTKSDHFDEILQTPITALGDQLSSRNELMIQTTGGLYDLYIYFEGKKRIGGVGFSLVHNSTNLIGLKTRYDKESAFLNKDFLDLSASSGITLHDSIEPNSSNTKIYSNTNLKGLWRTPPLGKDWFRLHLDLDAAGLNEQRLDLPLDEYRLLHLSSALYADFEVRRHKTLSCDGGYDLRHAFALDRIASNPFNPPIMTEKNFFTGLRLDFLFGKPKMQRDWNHKLEVDYRAYFRGGNNDFLHETIAGYHRTFTYPFFDVYTQASAALLTGTIHFFDELPPSRLGFSASLNRKIYLKKGGSMGGEARFNIYQRDIQVGIFDEILVFGKVDRTTNLESLEFANAVGPASYFLFFDTFQIYLKYAFGITTEQTTSHDVMVGLRKIL
ncbi:MAG: DUF309 domain-containing protein [Deltaproteobacteria bacterium]|nr:DUF309 domain-containing protein [Deltaproteobacteria bacterium]